MMKLKTNIFTKKNIAFKIFIVFLCVVTVSSWLITYDNFQLDTEYIDIRSKKLPKELEGFRIAHISDYHNRKNPSFDEKIFHSLEEAKPDIIVLTGDLVDKSHTDVDVALSFASRLLSVAPVYYVLGNHEANICRTQTVLFEDMIKALDLMGIVIMRNNHEKIYVSDDVSFNLFGLDEPYFYSDAREVKTRTIEFCKSFEIDKKEYNVLLAHHPEQLNVYADYNFDLVFSGHAHAGQFRIFKQGIFAPDQGLLPKYTSGLYEMGNTKLILSRGLGNSVFPFRIFNQSHLIVTEFKIN